MEVSHSLPKFGFYEAYNSSSLHFQFHLIVKGLSSAAKTLWYTPGMEFADAYAQGNAGKFGCGTYGAGGAGGVRVRFG